MSGNIHNVFVANPTSTIGDTDLQYIGQGGTVDAAIQGINFKRIFQQSSFNIGIDSGVADAYVVTLSPAPSSLTNGLTVMFVAQQTNLTDSPTIKINSFAVKPLENLGGQGVAIGDIKGLDENGIVTICNYSLAADAFVLINPQTMTPANLVSSSSIVVNDIGAINAYAATNSLFTTSFILNGGMLVILIGIANTNTGASTFNLNGSGALPVVNSDGTAISAGQLVAGANAIMTLTAGSKWQLH